MKDPGEPVVVHLDGHADETLRECADVLCCHVATHSRVGAEWVGRLTLARYPGCALVVVRGSDKHCLALTRTGAVHEVRLGAMSGADTGRLAVECYARLVGDGLECRRALSRRRAASAGSPDVAYRTH